MANLQYFFAKNDVNGNPRRIFVYSDENGKILAAWDEGYIGIDCLPGDLRQRGRNAAPIYIKVHQYNWLKKLPSPAYSDQLPA
jgi:hypothetical protein